MAKITKATFKSFIRKNEGKLFIKNISEFSGMTDSVEYSQDPSWSQLLPADRYHDNNLGYQGIWLVGSSGNLFNEYNKGGYTGIEVYNCCGTFIIATKN